MISSIIYILSSIFLMICFLLYPKSAKKQNFLVWMPVSYILYECFVCLWGGILTIIHLPANITSISIVNIIAAIFFIIKTKSFKQRQKIFVCKIDIVAFIFFLTIIGIISVYRFSPDFSLNYETSDPGPHLKFAMDCVNGNTVVSPSTNMYIGQFTNALIIEMLYPIFNKVDIYKSFILKDIFNWMLSAFLFYSTTRKYMKSTGLATLNIILTILYFLGYPLNNLLFGFVYLGITMNIILFLIFAVDLYRDSDFNKSIALCMLSLGCLGVVLGYSFFAPIVFLSICGTTTHLYHIQVGTWNLKHIKTWIIEQLKIFFVPTIYAYIFIILWSINQNNGINSMLSAEGYIYRNLYSDFIIYIPFAIMGTFLSIKLKEWNFGTTFLPLILLYCLYWAYQMVNQSISTYYYYKLNFAIWLILFYLTAYSISYMWNNSKEYIISYFSIILIVFFVMGSKIEYRMNALNINNHPFPNALGIDLIYEHNWIYINRKGISKEFIELCNEVTQKYKENDRLTPYIGDWLQNYWFEALTNQRQNDHYAFLIGPHEMLKEFHEGLYSNYMLIIKNSEEYETCRTEIDKLDRVFENNIGFIVKR